MKIDLEISITFDDDDGEEDGPSFEGEDDSREPEIPQGRRETHRWLMRN